MNLIEFDHIHTAQHEADKSLSITTWHACIQFIYQKIIHMQKHFFKNISQYIIKKYFKRYNVIEMTASILHNNQNCKELGPIKWDNFIMFIITCNFQTEKKMGFTWYIIFSPNELKI